MEKFISIVLSIVILLYSCNKDAASNIEKRNMPATVVSINQHLTEISKTNGSTPSIVLIAGFGSELKTWQKLYSALDPNATVFTYNRAGIGASANISGERDAQTIANEMRDILNANNIKPPYILVAHSMGGIYARMFYHQNPDKVKGLVLIDATHEQQLDSLLSMIPQPDRDMAINGMIAANEAELSKMPAGSLKEEFRANFATNYQQIQQYPAITNIPMYVLTSTKITDDNPAFVADIHKALHQQWATNAGTNGRFIVTDKSGHNIHIEEPGLVANGIRWVLSK